MAKIDRERQREAVMRFEAGPFLVAAFTLADFDGLEHADELLGRVLLDDAGRAQQVDERGRAAVHDGDFFGGQVDMQVVDAQAGQRRHEMLHRGNADIALLQHRRHARVAHAGGLRGQVHDLGQVDAVKHDPGVGLCRAQGELYPPSGVDADACRADEILNAALSEHDNKGYLSQEASKMTRILPA